MFDNLFIKGKRLSSYRKSNDIVNHSLWYKVDGDVLYISRNKKYGYFERELSDNTQEMINGWYNNRIITKAIIEDDIYPLSCALLFFDNVALETIENIGRIHVEYCKNFFGMFGNCRSLKNLDIRGWDVSNATDMSLMFCGCSSLLELHLNFWDVTNVKEIRCMFSGCTNLRIVNLEGWRVGCCTMDNMFGGCNKLKQIVLSAWRVCDINSLVTMFNNCAASPILYFGWGNNPCQIFFIRFFTERTFDPALSGM